ncbi:toll/interleukin-1 receptor domain-containing protein [Ruminococcus flavefaciens]|jgi:hypothetical protein|uniref:toll/interleukin-1 receptor domain-containing protein n=1 Tax=Ruminococcus flavefaciens TaxID=1265 RepID=UPI000491C88C|nr:toll/interleukin-1 receptor domain-containing protein [Ruminococcus flavefaciens]
MKVFISHKDADSAQALLLKKEFEKYDVSAYLDVLDNDIKVGGKQLTDHIRKNLNACSDLIVVMSEKTKSSWWVPFEIGMSAQVDMPTATFLSHMVALPDYLTYWPRLRSLNDIALYVRTRNKVSEESRVYFEQYSVENRQRYETERFYAKLKEEMRR